MENFAGWVRDAIQNHVAQGGALEDEDAIHLSIRPQLFASRYTIFKAYGNHYRVSLDTHGTTMATYDSKVALIFQQEQQSLKGNTFGIIQYVGVLRDIILLNYEPIS